MIECIFTLDYELYGDGTGSLRELVYEPASRLRKLFLEHGVRFVTFVEVAELEKIEEYGADPAVGLITRQIKDLFDDGFEIGLHLHPQWCRARYERGRWVLDSSEYNLCALPESRLTEVLDASLRYLRRLVGDPRFTPVCFRAGNWLFQPTQPAARVLARQGVRVDSSLFKGGLLHTHRVDYRRSLANGAYWRFERDVNEPEPAGVLVELPIFVRMVPTWSVMTAKRLALGNAIGHGGGTLARRVNRVRDLLRLRYPLKLDFCRMCLAELTATVDTARRAADGTPGDVHPVVAIGHTKELVDLDAVDGFLRYLETNRIPVSTFASVYPRLEGGTRN